MNWYQAKEANQPVASLELRRNEIWGGRVEGWLCAHAYVGKLPARRLACLLLKVTNERPEVCRERFWWSRGNKCNGSRAVLGSNGCFALNCGLNRISCPYIRVAVDQRVMHRGLYSSTCPSCVPGAKCIFACLASDAQRYRRAVLCNCIDTNTVEVFLPSQARGNEGSIDQ